MTDPVPRTRRWLPRSFSARATLIVLLPVLMVQLAVTVSFLQRHYEDVTDQMTANMSRAIALVRDRPALGPALGIDVGDPPDAARMRWFDLSGRAMAARLDSAFADLAAVDTVSVHRTVRLAFDDGTGLSFSRRAVSASNPHQLLVLMMVVGLLMIAISMLFLRGQIRPIRRLAEAAEAFGRGESIPFRPAGATEVRQAGTAFHDMRARIERHIEQRTLLLSGVSHDLRTPLTRMTLELSMMDGPEAEALRGDVDAMRRIIDTFLDFARADATADWDEVDATALVRDAVARAAPDRDVPVDGPDGERMHLSPTGLRRAVGNLIRNAGRYGDRVRVGIAASPQSLVVSVEDDGPGIPATDRETAIRPFARLDAARRGVEGNVGLGLAIVQDVARAHGGVLRLDRSESLGGLKAEIVLPR